MFAYGVFWRREAQSFRSKALDLKTGSPPFLSIIDKKIRVINISVNIYQCEIKRFDGKTR